MTIQPLEDAPAFSVLIIDNHAAMRNAIARILERDGFHVTTASDAVEGLQAVRSQRFDVVITDVQMHRRGGMSLLEQALELQPELWDRFVFIRPDRPTEPGSDEAPNPIALAALQSEVQRIVRTTNRGTLRRL